MTTPNKYIDAILYFQSYSTFIQHISSHSPHLFSNSNEINVFARTPAQMNGDSLLVYVRLTEDNAATYRSTDHVEILAESPYVGKGTADELYNSIFNDSEKLEKYKSVYDFEDQIEIDEEGNEYTISKPERFGIIAGA